VCSLVGCEDIVVEIGVMDDGDEMWMSIFVSWNMNVFLDCMRE
jgi:hypothetical protein